MSVAIDELKEARHLLKWTQLDLSLNSGVGLNTISYAELKKKPLSPRTLHKLQTALEAAGVEFIAENGGAGVRLRKVKSAPRASMDRNGPFDR